MSAAQPSPPSQTCNTSSYTPDSRLSVDIVHTVFPPDIKVTYHDVYIENVRGSTTKDDIRKQRISMGVREIGNIIPLRSKNMSTTAFIADQYIDTNVYNKEYWNINVEPYRVRRKIQHQNIRIREAEQKAHQQHSSNESTHHAPNRSGRSRSPHAPRTPRRVRPQLPPRFDRTPDERADSINGAPNDTAYKRWSCHSGLKLLCKWCRTSPPPVMGARFTVFWVCRPCGPAGWLALLLTKAGDVYRDAGSRELALLINSSLINMFQ